ncbi:uncharacterized protein LOC141827886 isoform X2 [Curcuma longa]|uniref:uncharacterized protein LOC141827886 isoform X2 n=1 Tax=Curcuma longa TaxID=136217 RepID=UPI003D9F2791
MEASTQPEAASKPLPRIAARGDGEEMESPDQRSSGAEASVVATAAVAAEVEFASCDCCGLTEECTPAYIAVVRERHVGRWICGLCEEAVRDEISRSELLISTEEAMGLHATFCRSFRSAEEPAVDPAEQLIAAVKHLLRRSLESPRAVRSTPSSPRTGGGLRARSNLVRTGSSGFPELLG